jgi:hypothetical protein
MLNVGESHMGKTRALSTLKGNTVIFNFEPPDNVSSLTVPYVEMKRLTDWWKLAKPIEGILVVQYGMIAPSFDASAFLNPTKDSAQAFIEDMQSLETQLGKVDNLVVETLEPLSLAYLEFIAASGGGRRSDAKIQLQDYNVLVTKVRSALGKLMSFGKNFVLTAHLDADKDETTGRVKVLPMSVGRKLGPLMPKLFSEIFCSEIRSKAGGGIEYVWNTKPEPGGFLTFLGSRKDKNGKLPKYIEPNYGYLETLLKEVEKK